MPRTSHPRPGTVVLLAALGVSACGEGRGTPTGPAQTTPSAVVTAYLDQLVTVMQRRSINRLSIQWPAFRTAVLAEAGAAQTIPEAYPAVRVALGLLPDNHSFYVSSTGSTISNSSRRCSSAPFEPPLLPEGIGYVRVGSFSGFAPAATGFADSVQRTISSADRADLTGWIVDLRGDGGGKMWPMVAGVGPVLGGGTIGYTSVISTPNERRRIS